MSNERTELEELGEFGLIKRLTENNKSVNPSTLYAVGDDAAIIDAGEGKVKVVTTDMLMEGIHFDLMYTPLIHLGYKAVVVNLSDVYAMNATPKQVTVSIALSNRFSLEAVEELYRGIYKACTVYGVDLVGGDTTSSLSGLAISVTAVGEAKKEDVVYRKNAQEKDLLVVSGDLGGAYMGLQVLEREKKVFKETSGVQPKLEGNDYILERQLKPEARKDIIEMLEQLGVKPSSMIDISDGLASEVLHLSDQSGLGSVVYEDKIPIDPTTFERAREFHLDPTVCALSGGEDYELLFTISQEDYEKIKGNPNMTVIGYMVDKASGNHLIDKREQAHPLTAQGWDPLLKKEEE